MKPGTKVKLKVDGGISHRAFRLQGGARRRRGHRQPPARLGAALRAAAAWGRCGDRQYLQRDGRGRSRRPRFHSPHASPNPAQKSWSPAVMPSARQKSWPQWPAWPQWWATATRHWRRRSFSSLTRGRDRRAIAARADSVPVASLFAAATESGAHGLGRRPLCAFLS